MNNYQVETEVKDGATEIYRVISNGKCYKVTLYTDALEKMNWSWDSLIFADNNDTFAVIENTSKKEVTVLNTHGEVKVYDTETDEQLSVDEVIELAKTTDLYDSDRYEVESNNWFGVEYIRENRLEEDDVFEPMPTTNKELINDLLDFHVTYFDRF